MTAAADRTAKLRVFTEWTAKHIKGDEKGEAQVFLDLGCCRFQGHLVKV